MDDGVKLQDVQHGGAKLWGVHDDKTKENPSASNTENFI